MTDLPPIPEDAPPFPEEYLDVYLEPGDAEPADDAFGPFDAIRRFEPTDDVAAEKVMRRLVAAHRRRRQILDQAEELLDPIIRWRDDALKPWDRRIAWLSDHLRLYAVKRRYRLGEKDPQAKTLKLPSGTVPTTRKEPRVDVMDEAVFVEWAKVNRPDLLRQPPIPALAPKKVEVKTAVQIVDKDGDLVPVLDGEIVPGLVVLGLDVTAEPKPDLSA